MSRRPSDSAETKTVRGSKRGVPRAKLWSESPIRPRPPRVVSFFSAPVEVPVDPCWTLAGPWPFGYESDAGWNLQNPNEVGGPFYTPLTYYVTIEETPELVYLFLYHQDVYDERIPATWDGSAWVATFSTAISFIPEQGNLSVHIYTSPDWADGTITSIRVCPAPDPCEYFTTPGDAYIDVSTTLLLDQFTIGVKISDWVSGPVYLQLYSQDVCDGWYQATLVDGWWVVSQPLWCADTLTVYVNNTNDFDGSLFYITDARVCPG